MFKRGCESFSRLPEKKKSRIYLAFALAVSLFIKTVLLIMLHDAAINMDGTLYIRSAMEYAAGNFAKGIELYPMPLYPLILTAVHKIIPDWIMASYFVSITSMVLATIPLFHITRIAAGTRPAFWACLVFAALPQINEWSFYVSRDPIFLLTAAWFLCFALMSIRQTCNRLFIYTFILAWLSILFRVEGCILLFFYFTVLVSLGIIRKEGKKLYLWRAFLWAAIPAAAAGFLLYFFGPESLSVNRFSSIWGKLTNIFTGQFLQQYHDIYHFFRAAENHPPFSGLHFNLAALSRHYIFLLYTAGIVEILIKNIFVLSCIPLYFGIKSKTVSHGKFFLWLWLLFIALAYNFLLAKDFLSTRFLLIPSFIMLPWIGAGAERLWFKAFHGSRKKMILLLMAALITAPALKSFEPVIERDDAVPKAVKWLTRNKTDRGNRVLTTDKTAVFYYKLYCKDNFKKDLKISHLNNTKKNNIQKNLRKTKPDIFIFKLKKTLQSPQIKKYKVMKTIHDGRNKVVLYQRNVSP